ncbi:GYF domain-containing protein [Nibricoccus sp. IMCC34717]|uniref:GYF domain-containing protein n=1 Tax=Nibricoccus sp. IMCC34717 TaxID=3034021 RepID=UPI00384A9BF4
MYTVLGDDGKEYGPATAEQVLAWKRDGRVDDDTQVRRAGETAWVRLADLPELSGRAVADEAPPPLPEFGEAASTTTVVGAIGVLDPLECFERAWEIFKNNAALLMGVCAIVAGIQLLSVLHEIPAYVFAFLIAGPLYGGLARTLLRVIRGKPARAVDVFSGFREQRSALMQASVVRAALELAATVPFILHFQQGREMPVYLLVIAAFAGVYVSLAYLFTFPLIIDRGLGFWEAMEASRRLVMAQPFRILLLLVLSSAVIFLGLLCFLAGALVTFPIAMVAYCLAYEHVTRAAE